MGKIRIERQKGYYGMMRALKIIADGVEVGAIKQGQILIFDVPDGCQEIWGKMDWGETERLDVTDYRMDQTVVFKGRLTLNVFKGLGLSALPFEISVRQASEDELNISS